MRRHPRALEEAGISQERYLELMWICRQYPGYVRRIRRMRAGIVDRPARKSGAWKRPDPTGNAAASIADACAWMDARVKLIDDCARRAAPEAEPRVCWNPSRWGGLMTGSGIACPAVKTSSMTTAWVFLYCSTMP